MLITIPLELKLSYFLCSKMHLPLSNWLVIAQVFSKIRFKLINFTISILKQALAFKGKMTKP